MKVVIPGLSGRVARLVAERLLTDGHEVIGIDRRPWPGAPKLVQMYAVDIRKRAAEEVFRKHRPDAVIHMATVTLQPRHIQRECALAASGDVRMQTA